MMHIKVSKKSGCDDPSGRSGAPAAPAITRMTQQMTHCGMSVNPS
jgi:hypothetical protein